MNSRGDITTAAEPDVHRALSLARFIAQNESELIFIDARYRPSASRRRCISICLAGESRARSKPVERARRYSIRGCFFCFFLFFPPSYSGVEMGALARDSFD